jgi:hypothetical protein
VCCFPLWTDLTNQDHVLPCDIIIISDHQNLTAENTNLSMTKPIVQSSANPRNKKQKQKQQQKAEAFRSTLLFNSTQ